MTEEKFKPKIGEVAKYIKSYMGGVMGEYNPKEDINVDIMGPGYKANLRVFDNDRDWRLELMDLPFGVAKVEGINTYEYGEFLQGFVSVVVPLVISQAARNERLPEIDYRCEDPLQFTLTTYNHKEVEFYGLLEKATRALVEMDGQLGKYYNTKISGLLGTYGCDNELIKSSLVHKVA